MFVAEVFGWFDGRKKMLNFCCKIPANNNSEDTLKIASSTFRYTKH